MKLDELGTDSNRLHMRFIMKVIVPLTVEEKADELSAFMSKDIPCFCPQVIIVTSGICNAGIDCANMVGVFRLYMPSSCIDVV